MRPGVGEAPRVAFDRLATANWADGHAGRLSISGVQPKAPAALAEEGRDPVRLARLLQREPQPDD